jgi:hypothetical protein
MLFELGGGSAWTAILGFVHYCARNALSEAVEKTNSVGLRLRARRRLT